MEKRNVLIQNYNLSQIQTSKQEKQAKNSHFKNNLNKSKELLQSNFNSKENIDLQ